MSGRPKPDGASVVFRINVSFSCPHFEPGAELCARLDTDCVPGRPGCVLAGKAVFAVPVETRIREKEEEKRRRALEAALTPPHGKP